MAKKKEEIKTVGRVDLGAMLKMIVKQPSTATPKKKIKAKK